MRYKSTRNSQIRLEASQVIARGISQEGGLFVPESLPDMRGSFPEMAKMDYHTLAKAVFSRFLTDFTPEEISECVNCAYKSEKFGGNDPVKLIPLTKNGEHKYMLELWHGPTCAFKDMALQILPHFLTNSLKKSAPGKEAVILVATSGDTGKAALEGFRDVAGTKIIVFYPRDGVSPMQKRQMVTQEGKNLAVCAIEGNFDDAQTGVKRIFTDETMKELLQEQGMMFSSANSINWGRLLPQVVYYFYSYFQLFRSGEISSLEEKINIVVPTGNFGNILAAYYAGQMGLPVKKFICASNANNVLTDFINTGIYDRRREFFTTDSPSMDILVSSNLERLLYALSGEDSVQMSQWMESLNATGVYDVGEVVRTKVQNMFYGGFCTDEDTAKTIRDTLEHDGYLCDTHTAVAVQVYKEYMNKTGDTETPSIIASTASPYKFVQSVLSAVETPKSSDEFTNIARLEELSGQKAPEQLLSLKSKKSRFGDLVVPKEEAAAFVLKAIKTGGN